MKLHHPSVHWFRPSSASVLTLMILFSWVRVSDVQETGAAGSSSCQYLDTDTIYSVEITKGRHPLPCPSASDLQDARASSQRALAAAVADVLNVQEDVTELLSQAGQMTADLLTLQQEFTAIKLALPLPGMLSANCPPGYTERNDEVGSCYMFVTRGLSWYNAQAFCVSTRGHLVAIETRQEQAVLVGYITNSPDLPGEHLWTGGNDIAAEGTWLWAGTNHALNYTQWLSYPHPDRGTIEQPDNDQGDEHCLQLFHLHQYDWNDNICGALYYFVCEYELP